MKVCFPDGTIVTARSLAERRERDPDRDFGLYMDAAWRPTWDAQVIEWADFGLPTDPIQAARSIVAAFKRAKAGERIEVGCVGALAGQVRCWLAWRYWQAYPSTTLCDGFAQTITAKPSSVQHRNAGLSGSQSES